MSLYKTGEKAMGFIKMAEEKKNPPVKAAETPAAPVAEMPAPQEGKQKRIGDLLVEKGIINHDQLEVALHEKQKSGRMVGEILVDLGFIGPDILTAFLAETTGLQQFDPKKTM